MTTVLVCGGRDFTTTHMRSFALGKHELSYFNLRMAQMWEKREPTLLVHGNAYGVDRAAGQFSLTQQCNTFAVPAKWNAKGKGAGHQRNWEMLNLLYPIDLVIAFPGGTGTANMISQAKRADVETIDLAEDWSEYLAQYPVNGDTSVLQTHG